MSERSLPPFKYLDPRRYPARLRDATGRLLDRFRRGRQGGGPSDEAATSITAEPPAKDPGSVTKPGGRGIKPATDSGSASTPVREPGYGEIGAADREKGAVALQSFLKDNATNVERAARTSAQAERLEGEGIPSDSARNRAERARGEVVDGLIRLRRSLLSSGETGAAQALDLEAASLDPPIPPGELRR